MTDKFYGNGYVLQSGDGIVIGGNVPTWMDAPFSNFLLVKQFMQAFDQEVVEKPTMPPVKVQQLRYALIEEELHELRDAMAANDIVEVADALTDLLYVVYGAGHAYGIDLDACFDEVHRSNMSKLGEDGKPIRREDGKVLKGPGYVEPDLQLVLFGEQESAV